MCIRDRDVSPHDLALAIYAAHRGEASLAPGIATKLMQGIAVGGNATNEEQSLTAVSYTHLRAHETVLDLVCRLLLEKKKPNNTNDDSTV